MNDLSEIFKPIFNFAGVIIALLIALRIFLLWWNSPSQKGKRGERLVAMRLISQEKSFPKSDETKLQAHLRACGQSWY